MQCLNSTNQRRTQKTAAIDSPSLNLFPAHKTTTPALRRCVSSAGEQSRTDDLQLLQLKDRNEARRKYSTFWGAESRMKVVRCYYGALLLVGAVAGKRRMPRGPPACRLPSNDIETRRLVAALIFDCDDRNIAILGLCYPLLSDPLQPSKFQVPGSSVAVHLLPAKHQVAR
ncbi:uncharacterized protein BDR25DRAFT_352177 [Lindgomyces ingoldianus]|uniref:Uncharacterized protein n=1 Tax=Lindgomyces ingoldianus TaxID=673940 RepID=A0ACB6R5V5_9PLEO|nr:uncharacterized protein BDR25DRAFT_352177 [Lindgomyces ingoldianus]KAF2473690.1 hypothetical protein BDR25DRAFT_352177 [Lindgomyces ingoldianus]